MTVAHCTQLTDLPVSKDEPQRFGRFVLLELLSDDIDSRVYRAIHQRLRKQVALKLLVPCYEDDARSRNQHLATCRVLCQLTHPNLVRVETAGEHAGTPYVVMGFVAGVDLQSLLDANGPLTLADASQLICQAAMGLEYLHEHDLTHGRMGLRNLMLTASGRLKIVGLGKMRRDHTDAQSVNDLSDLAHAFCELTRGEEFGDQFTLPHELGSVLQGLTSIPTEYSKLPLREFIKTLARLSSGSDLSRLLKRLDITPEAGSNDSLFLAQPQSGHDCDTSPARKREPTWLHSLMLWASIRAGRVGVSPSIPGTSQRDWEGSRTRAPQHPRKRFAFGLALGVVGALAIGGAFVGSSRWMSTTGGPESVNSTTHGNAEPPHSTVAADDASAKFATTDPDWDAAADPSSSEDLHHFVEQDDIVLGSIDADRDAFDVAVSFTDQGTEFTNLEQRGIVQLPVIMPEHFTLECTVERLEGNGSFGFGFSAGDARMMALLDHEVDAVWQSGMYFVSSVGKSGVLDPYRDQILVEGAATRLRLVVSPEHVELIRLDSSAQRLSGWTKSDQRGHRPTLGQSDGFYPQTFFVHAFRGAFRVDDLEISNTSADPALQPFIESGGRDETRLAQRIVWRGGHVEIITESGTRTIHRLQDLTGDPWLLGIEKCPAAPRLMIGDKELSELAKIKGIRKLDLTDSQVTSDGLAVVSGLRSLSILALPRHGIDGSVLASLHDLPVLRQLQLIGVSIHDEDVDELARFPTLKSLCLSGCPITDESVSQVAMELPELEHLCLAGTKITGECVNDLTPLTALKDLQLHGTAVGDEAIADLQSLTQLEKLTLHGSLVSTTAINVLQKARPGLEIK